MWSDGISMDAAIAVMEHQLTSSKSIKGVQTSEVTEIFTEESSDNTAK